MNGNVRRSENIVADEGGWRGATRHSITNLLFFFFFFRFRDGLSTQLSRNAAARRRAVRSTTVAI